MKVAEMKIGVGNDVYDIIRNDHRVINKDFMQVRDARTAGERSAAFDILTHDLRTHMKAEERYFYPILLNHEDSKRAAVRARDEHTAASLELLKIDPAGDWSTEVAQLDVLEELVVAHEHFEEVEVFDHARAVIPTPQKDNLTREFRQVETRTC